MLKIRVKAKGWWQPEVVQQLREAATWACKYHDLMEALYQYTLNCVDLAIFMEIVLT